MKNIRSSGINDAGLRELSYAISKLSKLLKLIIHLSWLEKITDKGLMFLAHAALQLKHLKLAEFNFICCRGVKEDATLAFKKTLRDHSTISEVYCNFEK